MLKTALGAVMCISVFASFALAITGELLGAVAGGICGFVVFVLLLVTTEPVDASA